MDDNIKQVVSVLTSDKKTTLFTATGEIIDMALNGPYDIDRIVEFLAPQITGTKAVEINLSNFLKTNILNLDDLADAGVVMTHIIDGKTVQGIFYPLVSSVEVTVGPDKVVIPHVDNLQAHMARAAADGSPSVANFFKRLAPVIKARKHSGEDLMKFIKRSEMPLTNTGRIIAYKRVTSAEEDYFVDTHSKQIKQRVGSRVTMPVDLVDPSRHNSCSTGLHVANLGYLRGFSGDKTIIVLVDPENFIAVPEGEDTKARVCSYDIIGSMNANQHKTVSQGDSIEEDLSFEELIKAAVEGRTIVPFEEIFVGNKTIERVDLLTPGPKIPLVKSKKPTTGKSLNADAKKAIEEPVKSNIVEKIRSSKSQTTVTGTLGLPEEVFAVFKLLEVETPKAEIARNEGISTRSIGRWMEKYDYDGFLKRMSAIVDSTEGLTIADQAKQFFVIWEANPSQENLDVLNVFKKSKKKSWNALGFTSKDVEKITAASN